MTAPVYAAILGSAFFLLLRAPGFLAFAFRQPDSFHWGIFSAFAGYFADAILALTIFGGFLFIGKKMLRAFQLPLDLESIEARLFALALGEASTAVALLILGLAGLYSQRVFYASLLALAWGCFAERAALVRTGACLVREIRVRLPIFEWVCALILGIALLRAVILNAAPPTDWDSLAYHLAFPKIFLQEGALVRLAWSTNGHYPLGSEMIYLLPMSLGRDMACHWINFFHAIGVLLAMSLFVQKIFQKPIGIRFTAIALGGATIYAVQPAFAKVTGNAATDMNVTFAALLAILALLRADDADAVEPDTAARWTLLCGTLTGIVMSMKLTGTWLALTLFLTIAALDVFKEERDIKSLPGRIAKKWIAFCAGICCTGLFWYAKNWSWTGNPIWPYMAGLFGGNPSDIAAWERMRASVTEGVPKTLQNFLSSPFLLLFRGNLFHYATQFLMIPFMALLIMSKLFLGWGRTEKILLGLAAVYFAVWFWVFQDWRYFLPVSALFAILVSGWAARLWNEVPNLFGRAALLAAVALIPLGDLSVNNELFVFFNLQSRQIQNISARDRYLWGSLGPFYAVHRASNALLPNDSKVLFYRDVRGYYLDRDYAWGDPLNPGVVSYDEVRTPADLHRRLRELGFTHILFNPYIGNYKGDRKYYDRADGLMTAMLRDFAERKMEMEGIALYELNAN